MPLHRKSASNSFSYQFGLHLAITTCTWSMAMFSSFLADDVVIYIGSIHCAWFSEVKVALPRYFSLTKIVSVIVRSVVVLVVGPILSLRLILRHVLWNCRRTALRKIWSTKLTTNTYDYLRKRPQITHYRIHFHTNSDHSLQIGFSFKN